MENLESHMSPNQKQHNTLCLIGILNMIDEILPILGGGFSPNENISQVKLDHFPR